MCDHHLYATRCVGLNRNVQQDIHLCNIMYVRM